MRERERERETGGGGGGDRRGQSECKRVKFYLPLTCKVCVVRRVDEIVSQGLVHVLAEIQFLRRDHIVVLAQQEAQEALQRQVTCSDIHIYNDLSVTVPQS